MGADACVRACACVWGGAGWARVLQTGVTASAKAGLRNRAPSTAGIREHDRSCPRQVPRRQWDGITEALGAASIKLHSTLRSSATRCFVRI